jgi:hypothetical protein
MSQTELEARIRYLERMRFMLGRQQLSDELELERAEIESSQSVAGIPTDGPACRCPDPGGNFHMSFRDTLNNVDVQLTRTSLVNRWTSPILELSYAANQPPVRGSFLLFCIPVDSTFVGMNTYALTAGNQLFPTGIVFRVGYVQPQSWTATQCNPPLYTATGVTWQAYGDFFNLIGSGVADVTVYTVTT